MSTETHTKITWGLVLPPMTEGQDSWLIGGKLFKRYKVEFDLIKPDESISLESVCIDEEDANPNSQCMSGLVEYYIRQYNAAAATNLIITEVTLVNANQH